MSAHEGENAMSVAPVAESGLQVVVVSVMVPRSHSVFEVEVGAPLFSRLDAGEEAPLPMLILPGPKKVESDAPAEHFGS